MLPVILTWVHVLCMIGAFGGLLLAQFGLPAAVRNSDEVTRGISKVGNILIGLGFVAGILNYGLIKGHTLGPHFNGVVAVKFVILLAVGALLGMSKKPGKGDTFRTIALVLLAIAAFAGMSLRLPT